MQNNKPSLCFSPTHQIIIKDEDLMYQTLPPVPCVDVYPAWITTITDNEIKDTNTITTMMTSWEELSNKNPSPYYSSHAVIKAIPISIFCDNNDRGCNSVAKPQTIDLLEVTMPQWNLAITTPTLTIAQQIASRHTRYTAKYTNTPHSTSLHFRVWRHVIVTPIAKPIDAYCVARTMDMFPKEEYRRNGFVQEHIPLYNRPVRAAIRILFPRETCTDKANTELCRIIIKLFVKACTIVLNRSLENTILSGNYQRHLYNYALNDDTFKKRVWWHCLCTTNLNNPSTPQQRMVVWLRAENAILKNWREESASFAALVGKEIDKQQIRGYVRFSSLIDFSVYESEWADTIGSPPVLSDMEDLAATITNGSIIMGMESQCLSSQPLSPRQQYDIDSSTTLLCTKAIDEAFVLLQCSSQKHLISHKTEKDVKRMRKEQEIETTVKPLELYYFTITTFNVEKQELYEIWLHVCFFRFFLNVKKPCSMENVVRYLSNSKNLENMSTETKKIILDTYNKKKQILSTIKTEPLEKCLGTFSFATYNINSSPFTQQILSPSGEYVSVVTSLCKNKFLWCVLDTRGRSHTHLHLPGSDALISCFADDNKCRLFIKNHFQSALIHGARTGVFIS